MQSRQKILQYLSDPFHPLTGSVLFFASLVFYAFLLQNPDLLGAHLFNREEKKFKSDKIQNQEKTVVR